MTRILRDPESSWGFLWIPGGSLGISRDPARLHEIEDFCSSKGDLHTNGTVDKKNLYDNASANASLVK